MFVRKVLALFLTCLSLACCDDKKNENTLIVATSADYPPFEFYKDGQIVGFEIDLIRAIAKELNKEIILKDMSFDSLIGGLQSGRIDIAISAISATPEREEKVDFTIPYHRTLSVMLVDQTSPITKPDDLSNKSVGVQMGTTYEKMIKQDWQPAIQNLSIRSLSKVPDLIQDYKSGRLNAIVLGINEAESIVKTYPEMKIIPISSTKAVYAIALPKGSPLTDQINSILKKWQADGSIKKIQDAWLLKEKQR
jgi:ABC-type amino acid transport substrate-binding protein